MKKVYTVTGLDCPNCAAKLEKKWNDHPDVEEAVLTYATEQLRLVADNPDELIPELQKIADDFEDGVKIQPLKRAKSGTHSKEHHHHHHEEGEECHCGEDHDHEHEHHHHHHEEGEECHCGEDHEHEHHHHHDHAHHAHSSNEQNSEEETDTTKQELSESAKSGIRIGVGTVCFIIGEVLMRMNVPLAVYLAVFIVAYLILGGSVVWSAIKNIGKGQVFDENFLMSIATIGAFVIGEYPEAVGVMLFYNIGELFEEIAVSRSRAQIMEAADMRPEVVDYVSPDGSIVTIDAEEAQVGDVIVVRAGDRIPLDGVVVAGESRIDTSPVTGEPVPVAVKEGSEILSGCVNESGLIRIQITKELADSMVTRILDSVENAAASKPKVERFITQFARVYTPFVVALAALTAIVPSLLTGNWSHWIYTALTFLVISCPCALVLSVPLAFFAGIGAGSKQGILFKGGVAIEALNNVKTIVMDKTGTITKGDFTLQRCVAVDGVDEERLVFLAAVVEAASTHPIAQSIVASAQQIKETHSDWNEPTPVTLEEIAGKGIKAVFDDGVVIAANSDTASGTVLCGNRTLFAQEGIDLAEYDKAVGKTPMTGSEVLVAWNQKYVGYLIIADTIKPESSDAIAAMHKRGLVTAMLTGDAEKTANAVAQQTGIERVAAGLLPDGKVEELSRLRSEYGNVMFIGDGINDAPVLAGADVGAAMGSGADAAIEAADVVFMNSSLLAVPESIRIANLSCRIAKQNVYFALLIKAAVMVLGLCGIASMWMAVFADSGVAMLCVLNSVRALKVKKS